LKVINLFGGPGIGKSTTATQIFYTLKSQGKQVELVTEYAKDLTWDNSDALNNSILVFAQQYHRLQRLIGKVDYAVIDSPIILCLAYVIPDYFKEFAPLVISVFNSFDNHNLVLQRDPKRYNMVGRNQTLDEALVKDQSVFDFLHKYKIDFKMINKDDVIYEF